MEHSITKMSRAQIHGAFARHATYTGNSMVRLDQKHNGFTGDKQHIPTNRTTKQANHRLRQIKRQSKRSHLTFFHARAAPGPSPSH
mmetsp:Transcript_16958/g.43015  ORF Transcript_16958/g.43015 Transcript_16958/m.43015 type:complete len:86 (-) Transcript_16958:506-763(-)